MEAIPDYGIEYLERTQPKKDVPKQPNVISSQGFAEWK